MTRSTPGRSSSGKAEPQSTTRISCSVSKTVRFLPISPRPPREMILSGGRRVPSAFLPRRALRLGCCAAAAGFLLPPLAAGCFLAGSLLAGLFCAAGWVCFLGSFFAAALGCCLGLPSALPLAEEAFCSFWAAGFCSSAGLDLPVWPPWPFWPFLALACAGFCWEALG